MSKEKEMVHPNTSPVGREDNMLERLARAACRSDGCDPDHLLGPDYPEWKGEIPVVRAVLIEMTNIGDDAALSIAGAYEDQETVIGGGKAAVRKLVTLILEGK